MTRTMSTREIFKRKSRARCIYIYIARAFLFRFGRERTREFFKKTLPNIAEEITYVAVSLVTIEKCVLACDAIVSVNDFFFNNCFRLTNKTKYVQIEIKSNIFLIHIYVYVYIYIIYTIPRTNKTCITTLRERDRYVTIASVRTLEIISFFFYVRVIFNKDIS